jgi:hypothetical protein
MPANLEIDPDAAFVTGVANRLALSLATLVVDQTLLSESDVPFEPFTAGLAIERRLTANAFREAVGFDSSRQVDLEPASRFFARVAANARDNADERGEQVLAVLETVMRRTLGSLYQVFVRGVGIVEVPFFLFGRLRGGPLVGLRSTAIET